MAKDTLAEGTFCQVALVVRDVEAASRAWAEVLGVEPAGWVETGPADETHVRYRGAPTDGRAKLAFFRLGPVSLELIEPIGGPSTWQEGLGDADAAFHHVAFRSADADAAAARLESAGCPTVQTGEYPGGRYVYADARRKLGLVLELLEDRP